MGLCLVGRRAILPKEAGTRPVRSCARVLQGSSLGCRMTTYF